MRILIIQPWIRHGRAEQLSVRLGAKLEEHRHEAPIVELLVDPHSLPPQVASRSFYTAPTWLAARFARSRALVCFAGPLILPAISGQRAVPTSSNPHDRPAPLVAAIVNDAMAATP